MSTLKQRFNTFVDTIDCRTMNLHEMYAAFLDAEDAKNAAIETATINDYWDTYGVSRATEISPLICKDNPIMLDMIDKIAKAPSKKWWEIWASK